MRTHGGAAGVDEDQGAAVGAHEIEQQLWRVLHAPQGAWPAVTRRAPRQVRMFATPTQITFTEDPVRMVRAVRFAALLGFEIEAKTLSEAVTGYAEAAKAAVDGGQLDEYLPTTLVLQRDEKHWKIIHAHRSTDYETMQQYVALQQQRDSKKK